MGRTAEEVSLEGRPFSVQDGGGEESLPGPWPPYPLRPSGAPRLGAALEPVALVLLLMHHPEEVTTLRQGPLYPRALKPELSGPPLYSPREGTGTVSAVNS